MMRVFIVAAAIAVIAGTACFAADNELTAKEKEDGWLLLFNGKDYTGWKCNNGKKVASPIENGAMVPYKSGGYVLINEKQFGDFILKCDVLMPKKCNSGVFFRIGNPKNPVQTGFEMQVLTGTGKSYNSFGAIYDLAPNKISAGNGEGKWDSIQITCKGPMITVEINGKKVSQMNCDEFTQPGKRKDGTKCKFRKAIKDFPRKGYLGFQDHGAKCWYKNVKLLELKAE